MSVPSQEELRRQMEQSPQLDYIEVMEDPALEALRLKLINLVETAAIGQAEADLYFNRYLEGRPTRRFERPK